MIASNFNSLPAAGHLRSMRMKSEAKEKEKEKKKESGCMILNRIQERLRLLCDVESL